MAQEPIEEPRDSEDATEERDGDDTTSELDGDETTEALEAVESLGRDETRLALHALLFTSDRPMSADRLAEALGDIDRDVVTTLLDELGEEIETMALPYTLRAIAGGYELSTQPDFAPYIRRLHRIKKNTRLSRAVLETLAIIAYKQPTTRAEVEAVRGVSVSHAFEVLQERRLIKVSGVAELPGRPKLFRTTDEFLINFGIRNLNELPSIEELSESL